MQYAVLRDRSAELVAACRAVRGDLNWDSDALVMPAAMRASSNIFRETGVKPGPIARRWAFLVGINRYAEQAFPGLNFCVNDVIAMKELLEGLGYTVVALHDQSREAYRKPTKNNIIAELEKVTSMAGKDDMIFAHFACHGENIGGKPVLIAHDSRANALDSSTIPVEDIEGILKRSKAQRQMLVLDACHVGVNLGRKLADPMFIKNVNDKAHGFVLFAGSTAQQVAQEWNAAKHGVFTYYLMQGLGGKAMRDGEPFVTVDGLKDFVLDSMRQWRETHNGLVQEPTVRAEVMGNMILADFRSYPKPVIALPQMEMVRG